ncbi:MAG: PilZ domain-containing protein [Myxococcota bacterium]
MSERRSPRIRAAIGAILRQGEFKEPCLTRSVSVTGLAVTTKKQWDAAQPLQVDIVEDGFRLSASARVVRQVDTVISLEFDPSNPDVEPVMSGLMESLLSRTGSTPQDVDFSDLGNLEGKVKWGPLEKKAGFNPFAKRFTEADLVDISLEGASLTARRPPELGSEIIVVLEHSPEEEHLLKVQAKVVRHTDGGFAVQLVQPSRDIRQWITKFRSFRRLDDE